MGWKPESRAANPTLAEALARYDAAQGYLDASPIGSFSAISPGGHANTNKQSANRPLRSADQPNYYGDDLAGASFLGPGFVGPHPQRSSGRQRRSPKRLCRSGRGASEPSGQLANDYWQLRGLDAQAQLLTDTVAVYRQGAPAHQLPSR